MMTRERRTDHVGAISITTLRTGRWKTNCYILQTESSSGPLIVDPGDDVATVLRWIGSRRPTAVIATHGHYDHIGAAAEVCQSAGVPLLIDERDRVLLDHAPLYALTFEGRRIAAPTAVMTFQAPTVIDIGRVAFEVLPAPGHTGGSVVLRTGGMMFTGDTLLHEALGRTDLPGGDADALARTVEVLLREGADDVRIFPGHGRWWTIGAARAWWRGVRPS